MREEYAFDSPSLPCNTFPFLGRIGEILETNKVNNFEPLSASERIKVRGCMWVLMAQLYGQMATIDLTNEWYNLHGADVTE